MLSVHDVWDLCEDDKTLEYFTTLAASVYRTYVHVFIRWGLTESAALVLRPLSLDGLFDDGLSGAVETTLPTFDPVHQLNLLKFGVEPLEVPARTQNVSEHQDATKKASFIQQQVQIFWKTSTRSPSLTFQWCHGRLFWCKWSYLDPAVPETITASHLGVQRQTDNRKKECLMESDLMHAAFNCVWFQWYTSLPMPLRRVALSFFCLQRQKNQLNESTLSERCVLSRNLKGALCSLSEEI